MKTATEHTIQQIPIKQIVPPHEVREPAKLAEITASMKADGWQGRPLVIMQTGRKFQAITGSHRCAAAKAAKLSAIPCIVISARTITSAGCYFTWRTCYNAFILHDSVGCAVTDYAEYQDLFAQIGLDEVVAYIQMEIDREENE